jgi:multicomponent Na+:H+ antiporter subunit G
MTVVASVLVLTGAALVLLAGIGVVRFPDVLTRANAAAKATGLGIAVLLAGTAVAIGTPRALVILGAAVVVQFATSPVSGHVIGRAAYRSGAPLWEGTHTDDLRDWYASHPQPAVDPETRTPRPAVD